MDDSVLCIRISEKENFSIDENERKKNFRQVGGSGRDQWRLLTVESVAGDLGGILSLFT